MRSASELMAHVSKADLVELLDLIHAARSVGSEGQFRKLMHMTSRLLPMEKIHVSVAALDSESRIIGSSRQININYPMQWLGHYRAQGLMKVDPVAKVLFVTDAPIIWASLRRVHRSAEAQGFFGAAKEYGLRDGFSFGSRFSRSESGSFFTCEGSELTGHKRHVALTEYLLPYLHESLSRVHMSPARNAPMLTPREREVLDWIKFGKTDSEVALLLGTSSRTVKFHIENAMHKLQASNRTEAVARALAQGIITWS